MIYRNIFTILISFFGFFGLANASSLEFAKSMDYQTNYEQAITKAKKENKPVMLVLSSKTCPWCRKFENQTLRNQNINEQVHKNFIPLALDQSEDVYPEKFYPQYVPTVLFIDPVTQDFFAQSIGYKPAKKFQESIDEAIEDIKRLR